VQLQPTALELVSELLEMSVPELRNRCEHWAEYFELEALAVTDVWLAATAPAKMVIRDPHYPLHRAGDGAYIVLRSVDADPPPDYYTRASVTELLTELAEALASTLN